LRTAFAEFHPQVRQVLAACPAVHKWALVDRDPLPRWSEGNVTLLGDACHPMTPYMAQGAAMAIEDAAVLSRCLENVDRAGAADAFSPFRGDPQAAHVTGAARVEDQYVAQASDRSGVGLWYDAWTAPLADHGRAAAASGGAVAPPW
jgi:6-hydroxynicotinate 3-monooxygenase